MDPTGLSPPSLCAGRFSLRAHLGSGGFGAVYEAQDHERDATVALKLLHQEDPGALYQFKREFRALQDLSHPNLVTLYELLTDAGRWFFSMELVRGQRFDQHVSRGPASAAVTEEAAISPLGATPPRNGLDGACAAPARPAPAQPHDGLSLERLLDAAIQLAEGLQFLHASGTLHRDIKPANVLVDEGGRVVILDFGLALDLSQPAEQGWPEAVGTPLYVSPEQARALPPGPASDWYSMGVLLYQACTGRLPFEGTPGQVLRRKLLEVPPAANDLVEGLPPGLSALCEGLLQTRAEERPAGPEVLARPKQLRSGRPAAAPARGGAPPRELPLLGREGELAALHRAFSDSAGGAGTTVLCRGTSGAGKSALCQAFLRQLRRDAPEALVLSGRCYEREVVPFKALDGAIDALSRSLSLLPAQEIEAILPNDIALLRRLFPVLGQVRAIARSQPRTIPDAQQERRLAFQALRDLLRNLTASRPVALFIDDLQWGDLDSLDLLQEVLRQPEAPPVCLCVSYRREEEDSTVIAALRKTLAAAPAGAVREIDVEQLSPETAAAVARLLLGERAQPDLPEVLAEESRGNPFFLRELCLDAREREPAEAGDRPRPVSVDGLLRARLQRLPPPTRHLLEVACLAGRPLPRRTATRVVALGGEALDELGALSRLRVDHLLRLHASGGAAASSEEIVPYHDRVREAVCASLSPGDTGALHLRLATALEESGQAEPELLLFHYQGAGELSVAARYAAQAAARARGALAFDRAARLYRTALDLSSPDRPAQRSLQEHLGEALVGAGRLGEAAQAFLEAADGAAPAEGRRLRQLAMGQLLRGGFVEQGTAILRGLLREVGLSLPSTRAGAIRSLLLQRLWIRLRGLSFHPREASEIEAADLERVDTCWAAATGLATVDPLRSVGFQLRHLHLALRAGERYRASLALSWEGIWSSRLGGRRSEQILLMGQALSDEIGDPHAQATALLCAGMAASGRGQYRRGEATLLQAQEILQERCTGVSWERNMALVFRLYCLFYLGELRQIQTMVPTLLADARARGDRYLETMAPLAAGVWAALSQDRPEEIEGLIAQALRRWSQGGFQLPHMLALSSRASVALYQGDGPRARQLLQEGWPALARSGLLRLQAPSITLRYLRALASLKDAAPGDREREREAERDAHDMGEYKLNWSDALATLIRASLSTRRARRADALALWLRAEELAAIDMPLYSQCARRRRGELLGGEEGRALLRSTDEWLSDRGVACPERLLGALVPAA